MVNWRAVVLGVAAIVGVASGSSSLKVAASSRPSITWGSLAIIFGFSLVALPMLLGFQAALGNHRSLRWGYYVFLVVAVNFAASGLAALALAAQGSGLMPYSFLFLAIGVAMLAGLGVVRIAFGRKFANG